MVRKEYVGMLGFKAEGSEHVFREIVKVACHDDIAAANDCRCKHVAVLGVRQLERRDQILVAVTRQSRTALFIRLRVFSIRARSRYGSFRNNASVHSR